MDDDGVDGGVGWAQNLLFIAQQRDRILGSGLRGLQLFANSDQQPILLLLLFPSPSADNSYSANSWGPDSPPGTKSHRVQCNGETRGQFCVNQHARKLYVEMSRNAFMKGSKIHSMGFSKSYGKPYMWYKSPGYEYIKTDDSGCQIQKCTKSNISGVGWVLLILGNFFFHHLDTKEFFRLL